MRVIFSILALSAMSAFGAEYAVLASGAQLRIERHEVVGTTVRLYTSAEGFIELPADAVTAYEPIEAPAPPPPPAPVGQASTPASDLQVAPAPKPTTPHELVDRVAEQHGLPAALVHAVVKAESAYRQDAISPKGAIGMM
ncbi:MAG: lytic transglycosylase domain-containing protein, partial [Bryobacterales bacterium]|nr:lytic transglycosylase domain-containing protein [Bryobacterales bacterium]